MLSSSASLSCYFGWQEVGTCTPIFTCSAGAEHRLSAVTCFALQRHVFTGELSLESAEYTSEFENSNWPRLKHFMSSNLAYQTFKWKKKKRKERFVLFLCSIINLLLLVNSVVYARSS